MYLRLSFLIYKVGEILLLFQGGREKQKSSRKCFVNCKHCISLKRKPGEGGQWTVDTIRG